MPTPTDWVAYIGASAWLPTVFKWVSNKIEKPVIFPMLGNQGQIGYDSFGPSITLNVALTTKNKDAIVRLVKINLTHENGKKISFTWKSSSEHPFDVRGAGIPSVMNFIRNIPITAVKTTCNSVTDQRIYFQNDISLEKIHELKRRLQGTIHHQLEQNGSIGVNILSDPSFSEIKDHINNNFYWEAGRYQGEMEVYSINTPKIFKTTLMFDVYSNEIKTLMHNKSEASRQEGDLAQLIDISQIRYNFIYPYVEIKSS